MKATSLVLLLIVLSKYEGERERGGVRERGTRRGIGIDERRLID
jgi:hypothetical protein